MNIVEAIILGLLQGLTEFIPVSSSGHLVVAQHIFGTAGDHLFLEWINLGTLLALLIYFRRRIIDILSRLIHQRDYRLAVSIVIAAVPAAVVGYLFAGFIGGNGFFSSIWTVVAALGTVGILMVVIEKLPKLSPVVELNNLPVHRALLVGLAQICAFVPGVSRSGSTILAGRLVGMNPARAAEFSFLVSIPIMFGVILKLLSQADDRAYFGVHAVELLAANLVAFASGLAAVGFLMRYLERRSLSVFGWYRIALSLSIIIVLLIK